MVGMHKKSIAVHYPHTSYMYKCRSKCALEAEMSTRESRLPGPALLCQPSSHRLARQWEWGGRPCSFPELPSGHGDREAVENGSAAAATDPTAGPSSTRPSCTPPQPPPAASPAAASVPATIGRFCAILAHLARHLAHAIGLWREQSTALSAAPERGFKNATQACKEGPMGMGLVRDPSSWLARAVTGRSHMLGDVWPDMS